MIIRDLVTRMSFKADTSGLRTLETTLGTVKKSIVAIAGTALSGFMIKAGLDAENLYLQYDRLTKSGMEPLRKVVGKLESTALFDKRSLREAAIALAGMGFSGEEAALRLEQAVTLSARANKNIAQIAIDLGTALQKGGLAEYFLSLRLITLKQADDYKLVENKIASTSGEISERVTREYRKSVASVLETNRAILEEDQKDLIKRTGGVRRTIANLKNLWEELSRLIMTALLPVLNKVANLIDDAWRLTMRWRVEIIAAGGVWDWLFAKLKSWFPDHAKNIERVKQALEDFGTMVKEVFKSKLAWGLTIGGLLLFLITKSPVYLGIAFGPLILAGLMTKEWDGLIKELKKTITPEMLQGSGTIATIGGMMMFLLTKNPKWIVRGFILGGMLKALGLDTEKEKVQAEKTERMTKKYGAAGSVFADPRASQVGGGDPLQGASILMMYRAMKEYLFGKGGGGFVPEGLAPVGGGTIKIEITVKSNEEAGRIAAEVIKKHVNKALFDINGQGQ